MNRDRLELHQSCIPAAFDPSIQVRDQFLSWLPDIGITADEIEGWKLVYAEAVNNAIIHGSGRDPAREVWVSWWMVRNSVFFEVRDSGAGPPPSRTSQADLPDDLAEGGRGFFIMNAFASRIEHWRSESGYRITIIKDYPSLSIPPREDPEMDRVIEELSNSYESLSTFYSLGQSLIHSDLVRRFLQQTVDEIRLAHQYDHLEICLSRSNLAHVTEGLVSLASVRLAEPVAQPFFEHPRELHWDAPEEMEVPALLSPADPVWATGCCIPIQSQESVYGVLLCGRAAGGRRFYASDLNNLRTLADILSMALAKEILQAVRDAQQQSLRELQIATELQNHLLPVASPPQDPRWSAFLRRQSALEVAGDYAEATLDAEGNLLLSIIDVMGKGVSAAMLAIIFRAALSRFTEAPEPLEVMVESINRTLCHLIGNRTIFVTCTLLRIDRSLSQAEHVNAGHCPTILLRPGGAVEEIEASGPPLGLFADMDYTVDRISLQPGCAIILFTDGCYEWEEQGQMFGWERLQELAVSRSSDPAGMWESLVGRIESAYAESEKPRTDDATMIHWRYPKP